MTTESSGSTGSTDAGPGQQSDNAAGESAPAWSPDPTVPPHSTVPPQPTVPPYPAYPPMRRPTNNLALAALIVSLVSLMSCPLIGGVAIYLGNRARTEIARTGEDGAGLAQAGVIIGWCALGLAALIVLMVLAYAGFVAAMVGTTAITGS